MGQMDFKPMQFRASPSSKPFEQAQEQPVQVEQFALRFKTEEIAEGSRAEDAFQVSQKGVNGWA